MAKILINLTPFTLNQSILVCNDDDNSSIENISTMYDDIPTVIKELTEKYDINEITMFGNKGYLSNLSQTLSDIEQIKAIYIIEK